MHTKARRNGALRSVCLGILLMAVGFRLSHEWLSGGFKKSPQILVQRVTEQPYPLLLYTPPNKTAPREFAAQDAEFVQILNWSGLTIDAGALIEQPLKISLTDKPLILIVHTHATEAYADSDGYRTTDTEKNVVKVGQEIARMLNENGIVTLHETTLIDRSGYYDSYVRAAELIEAYLQEYPSIQMVIDVHRDAASDENGAQVPLRAQIDGQAAAQLMLVMGTNSAGLEHPNWEENLAFALKLQSLGEQTATGVFRDLNLRSERYNQHLTPHSILLEVGAAGNSLEEALTSARFFAQTLITLLGR